MNSSDNQNIFASIIVTDFNYNQTSADLQSNFYFQKELLEFDGSLLNQNSFGLNQEYYIRNNGSLS